MRMCVHLCVYMHICVWVHWVHMYVYICMCACEHCMHVCIYVGFPGGSDGKESACNVGDPGLIPWSGRPPRRREWLLMCMCIIHICMC